VFENNSAAAFDFDDVAT